MGQLFAVAPFFKKEMLIVEEKYPEMYDRPENGSVAGSGIYWLVCYFMIPFVTVFLSWAFSDYIFAVVGVDLCTYIFSFICMLALFRQYLADSFLNVSINKGAFIKTVSISAGLILVFEFVTLFLGGNAALAAFPISETSMVASTSFVVLGSPILGFLCVTVLTPVTVSCMFYATVFAPIACKRPLLGYGVLAVLLLFPRLLSTYLLQVGQYDISLYCLQLPIHMIACRAYQKTNTIWAPIIALSITNLATCVLLYIWYLQGYIYIS